AADRQEYAARRAHLDHALAEVGARPERDATEADQLIAALDADAGRRAARADLGDDQRLVVLLDGDADQPPAEIIGVAVGEGGAGHPHLALGALVADREGDRLAGAVVLDQVLELVLRAYVAAVDPRDDGPADQAGLVGRAVGLDLGGDDARRRAEMAAQLGGQGL